MSNLTGPLKREIQSTVTAAISCDGGISVLNHCMSWSKFVNTHLSHSTQWFNIHIPSVLLEDMHTDNYRPKLKTAEISNKVIVKDIVRDMLTDALLP